MGIQSNIGSKIQKIRQESSLSQVELARKAAVSYVTLTKIEAGVIKQPSFVMVAKIAKALGCSLDDLVFNKRISKHLVKFEAGGTKVYIPEERFSIDLSLTENPLKFSKSILDVIDKHKHSINHYPDPYHHELRKALSRKFGIHQEKFICGAGADGLIENIVRILINPGEQVILPSLSFLNASFAATIAGGVPVFSKMTKDFYIDFEDINKKINKAATKMIFICNPNNPTGTIEPREKIYRLLKSTNALVVVDEANIEFGGGSVIDYVNEFENLLVIRTFSKAYGLAGFRIGYCAGNEELLHYIWRLRPPFVNTVLAQKAAIAALRDEEHIAKSCIYVAKERQFLTEQLTSIGFTVVPSASNCILVKITPVFKNSTAFCKLLNNNDCVVVNGKYFEGLGDNYVRIAPQLHSTNVKFIGIVKKLVKASRYKR